MSQSQGFSLAQRDGRYWFVAPDNRHFLSFGVCCVDMGTKPDEYDIINPTYCALRHYKDPLSWSKDTQKRLLTWRFNTVGAWSEHTLLKSPSLYQTPVLHLSATGIPWTDPWDQDTIAKVNSLASSLIDKWKSDPNTIGYFSDNELGWWIGAIFEWAFKYPPNSKGRLRFVSALKDYYRNWQNLLTDFIAEEAACFDDLTTKGRLYLRPSSRGVQFARKWLGIVSDQYYRISKEAIKAADPKALYLGDRYISNYYPEVAVSASKHVDVVSTNLNADWDSGYLTPFYLNSLHKLTQKPILVTEFYSAAMENRSGNMNDSSGFPTTKTQRDRARSFERQVVQMLEKPYVVGLHWFQYYDEGMHGRSDGENYNMGLVDIYNKPYQAVTSAARRLFNTRISKFTEDLPKNNAIPYIDPYDARYLDKWNALKSFVPSEDPGETRGDMFLSWNRGGLYVAFHWYEDRFFEAFYKDPPSHGEDRAEVSLSVNGQEVHIQMDGISQATLSKGVLIRYSPGNGMNGNTRNTVIVRLPAILFGCSELEPGSVYKVSANLSTRGKVYQMDWKCEKKLDSISKP